MKKGEALMLVLLFIVVMGGGFALITWAMSGGSIHKAQRKEELDLEKPFIAYYSSYNSVFPLLAYMDYMMMLIGVIALVLSDQKSLGIIIIVVTGLILAALILKVRRAKDQTDRPILTVNSFGIITSKQEVYPWSVIYEVELIRQVRRVDQLQLVVRDEKNKHGVRKVPLAVAGTRYSPQYLRNVIEQYMEKYKKADM